MTFRTVGTFRAMWELPEQFILVRDGRDEFNTNEREISFVQMRERNTFK